jgi:hypothetical protein
MSILMWNTCELALILLVLVFVVFSQGRKKLYCSCTLLQCLGMKFRHHMMKFTAFEGHESFRFAVLKLSLSDL